MKILDTLILPMLAAALCGCGRGVCPADGGACRTSDGCVVDSSGRLASDACASDAGWDSSVDCMNGYCLVGKSGRMGMADARDGHQIVAPVYGQLFFLTDDILAGFEGGKWSFLDTRGLVLASLPGCADDDPDRLFSEYGNLRRGQLDAWERVVCGYERFCSICAGEGASLEAVRSMADSLLHEASLADGVIGSGQRRRIEAAYGQYVERRR